MSRNIKQILALFLLAGLLWLSDGWGWWDWLKRPMARLSQPIRRVFYQARVETDEGGKQELETAVWQAEIKRLKQENQELRKLLGAPLPADWQFVPAQVLQADKEYLVIDEGEDSGIKVGDQVIVVVEAGVENEAGVEEIKGGVLIGQVDELGLRQSGVRRLYHPESKVRVKTSSGVEGVVQAGAKEELILAEVEQKYGLEENELIISRGGDGWRPGLVIGKVGEVIKVETAVYQQAKVEELVKGDQLVRVWVVKG